MKRTPLTLKVCPQIFDDFESALLYSDTLILEIGEPYYIRYEKSDGKTAAILVFRKDCESNMTISSEIPDILGGVGDIEINGELYSIKNVSEWIIEAYPSIDDASSLIEETIEKIMPTK